MPNRSTNSGQPPGQRLSQETVQVNITSQGCGVQQYQAEQKALESGAEVLPWVGSHRTLTPTGEGPPAARLTGSLENLHQGEVDVVAACLEGQFDYDLVSDGPTTLSFSDGRAISLKKGTNRGTVSP